MISKEEIEFTIKTAELMMKLPINNSIIIPVEEVKKLFEYIDQLETREQKLIDKLEEDIANDYHIEKHYEDEYCIYAIENISTKEYAQEILSILKGKNNG